MQICWKIIKFNSVFQLNSFFINGKWTLILIHINSILEAEYDEENGTYWSIFPVENQELVFGNWEDDIIWDSEVSIVF